MLKKGLTGNCTSQTKKNGRENLFAAVFLKVIAL